MSSSPKVAVRDVRPDLVLVSPAGSAAMFSLLPQPKSRWREFLYGYSVTGVCVSALLLLAVLRPHIVTETVKQYHIVALVDNPPPVNHRPAPVRVIPQRAIAQLKQPIPDNLRLTAPKPQPQTHDQVAPKIQMAAEKAPLIAEKPVIPRQLVRTNVFSTGSSAIPTMAAAPQKVQTGGFGDPNGVPASANRGRAPVNIAQLGSFDLPSGPGYGNGTGGAHGVRGVVSSAGFGNGVATGDGSGRISASRGTVRQGGFGDADLPAALPVRPKKGDDPAQKITAVEIISKPTPAYTDEARKLRLEGEVLLEVVFEASGTVRVVRVLRGLGHGLDENAIRAAQQIHFKPALKAGQPTDSTATLHVIFQLA